MCYGQQLTDPMNPENRVYYCVDYVHWQTQMVNKWYTPPADINGCITIAIDEFSHGVLPV